MKKIISILLIICLLVAFSSCTISKNKEPTNPYQVTEKRTQIKENFDIDKINKITVTIGGNETEIKIDDEVMPGIIVLNPHKIPQKKNQPTEGVISIDGVFCTQSKKVKSTRNPPIIPR